MTRQPVNSSNLSSVGYENGTLEVKFNSGSVYQYFDVPQSVYAALMSASSHGSYLAHSIKNVYRYRKVG